MQYRRYMSYECQKAPEILYKSNKERSKKLRKKGTTRDMFRKQDAVIDAYYEPDRVH